MDEGRFVFINLGSSSFLDRDRSRLRSSSAERVLRDRDATTLLNGNAVDASSSLSGSCVTGTNTRWNYGAAVNLSGGGTHSLRHAIANRTKVFQCFARTMPYHVRSIQVLERASNVANGTTRTATSSYTLWTERYETILQMRLP